MTDKNYLIDLNRGHYAIVSALKIDIVGFFAAKSGFSLFPDFIDGRDGGSTCQSRCGMILKNINLK